MRRSLNHYVDERARVTFPWVTWDGGLSAADIDAIEAECLRWPVEGATILGSKPGERDKKTRKIRRSDIRWVKITQDNRWIFQKLDNLFLDINDSFYGFDLTGYDTMQYTEYRAQDKGHYDWHMDLCAGTENLPANMVQPRKLSITILLNQPGVDFQGGDFQFNMGMEKDAAVPACARGRIVAFPSWMIHRVAPVTQGVRKSLVVWIVGPKFI